MADFTITTTITGSVNGRALSIEHTYTVDDVVDVIEDVMTCRKGVGVATFNTSGQGRGYHIQNAPKFVCIAPQANGNGILNITLTGGAGVTTDVSGTVPLVFHHGEDWNGSANGDALTTIPDPDEDAEIFEVVPRTSFEARSIALFKPVS